MSTIYKTGSKFDIELFELVKKHPEIESIKVKKLKNGLIKTEYILNKSYESNASKTE